jgi:hypothetical protein
MTKRKKSINDPHNTTQKTKDRATRTALITGDELGCSGRVGISYYTHAYHPQYYMREEMFLIVNFPFICSNIPAASAYEVYISQLVRYSRVYGSYHNCLNKGLLLTRKLLNVCTNEENKDRGQMGNTDSSNSIGTTSGALER